MPHEEEYVVSNPNKDELPLEVPKEEITVQQILDRGSFGVIKFGIWRTQPVALKLQKNNSLSAHEAQLHHPNIVLLLAISRTPGGVLCMILEKMDMSLFDYLTTPDRPMDKKIFIATEVAKAVDYLHNEAQMIHRDIKVDNVLLRGDEVKLADFGLTFKISDKQKTEKKYLMGPWQSIAPEYIHTEGVEYTTQFDIYSFAFLLYALSSQHSPYPSFNALFQLNNMLTKIKNGSRPEVDFASPLNLVMTQCWDQNPNKRPDARELLRLLSCISSTSSGDKYPQEEMKDMEPENAVNQSNIDDLMKMHL